MIEYKKAVENDIYSLKELWLNTFDDKDTAVELFFKRIFDFDIVYVAKESDNLISMLYLLPTSVSGHKACYLYAAATKAEYRGKGIMGELIDFALNDTEAELCVTLPATESLYDFYGKFGFKKLTANSAKLSRNDLSLMAKPYQLKELIVNNYCGVRNRVLKSDFLFWNNNHIDYAFKYNELYGGKIIKSNFGYAIAYENKGICTISEIICADNNAPYLLTDILSEFSSEEFCFHLSPKQGFIKSQPETFGMVKYLSDYKPDNIYCGLTLD